MCIKERDEVPLLNRSLMVRLVMGSLPNDGPIELFFTTGVTNAMVCAILFEGTQLLVGCTIRPVFYICRLHKLNTRIMKEGRTFSFNDALNTFMLRLYGVKHKRQLRYRERKPAAATTWATLSD